MNKDYILGMAKSAAGRIKEIAGRAIGDQRAVAAGLALRLAGKAQIGLGRARETIRKLGR